MDKSEVTKVTKRPMKRSLSITLKGAGSPLRVWFGPSDQGHIELIT